MIEDAGPAIQDLYQQLRVDLPEQCYELDDSRGFPLTGIKAAYVVERLNQVFGLCGHGWYYTLPKFEIIDPFVLVHLELYWRFNGSWSKPVLTAGGTRIVKGRIGDAAKGAMTDALKKAASLLGVGHVCYKGLKNPPGNSNTGRSPRSKPPKHWIDDDLARRKFWTWAKGVLNLTKAQVFEGLQIKRMHDFKGSMDIAKAALEAYAIDGDEA